MKQVIIISILFFSQILTKPQLSNPGSIKKLFNAWNKETINSIKLQLPLTNDTRSISFLKTSLNVFEHSLYSPTRDHNGVEDKGEPARYKFLQSIFFENKIKKNTFIIESVNSGEVVQSRNYLISNNLNTSHVKVYCYFKNDWVKIKDTTISKVDLHFLFKKSDNSSRLLVTNLSHVIITEFNVSDIISRSFFPYYNLPCNIEFNNILSKILEL